MRFWIEHETRLEFSAPVAEHHIELRLSPRPSPSLRVLSAQIDVEPSVMLQRYTDGFGNAVHSFDVLLPHQTLVTRLRSEVETLQTNPFDYIPLSAAQEKEWYRDRLKEDPLLWQYLLHRSPVVPEWATLQLEGLAPVPMLDPEESIPSSLHRAVDWVASVLRYQPGTSHTHSTLQEVLTRRQGVCQDFAHLLLTLVRSWHIPARYVMGYMDAGIEGHDVSPEDRASHAWVDVLIPGAGWRGYDATNRLCANDLYIPMAIGRDYLDAAPQRGTFKGRAIKQEQTIRVALERKPPDLLPMTQSQSQAAQ